MKTSSRFNYFWLGFTVGAASATLLAAKSGAETRAYCQVKTRETADRVLRQIDGMRDRAIKTMEHRKRAFQQQIGRFSAAVDAGKKALRRGTAAMAG